MATALKIKLPRLHAAQQRVLDESRRFNVVCCGRRFGKTVLGVDRLLKAALEGHPAAWFAPSYKSLSESWRLIQTILDPVVSGRNNAEARLELKGGGSIVMWSLDGEVADLVRGRAYKTVIVDEAATVRGLLQSWENSIRPCLADFRGDAWFLSTPRGMNDFKTFYDRGADPEREDWRSWRMPTSSNPYIAAAEIESARQDLSERAFNQEYLASFESWEGAVFRNVRECATVERKSEREPGHTYVIGADWGRSNDYTVFVVLDTTARCMVDMDRSNRIDYVVQRGRLQALYEKWQPSKVIAEQNSIGQPVIEQLQRDGMPVTPFVTTNASKAQAVEALALAFERGDIRILNDPLLLSELEAFACEPLPGGQMRYSAPSGGHDDCVLSLCLAWSGVRRERVFGVLGLARELLNGGFEELKRLAAPKPAPPVQPAAQAESTEKPLLATAPGAENLCPRCGNRGTWIHAAGWHCTRCNPGVQWWGSKSPAAMAWPSRGDMLNSRFGRRF